MLVFQQSARTNLGRAQNLGAIPGTCHPKPTRDFLWASYTITVV